MLTKVFNDIFGRKAKNGGDTAKIVLPRVLEIANMKTKA
jgi:hypothetical protein